MSLWQMYAQIVFNMHSHTLAHTLSTSTRAANALQAAPGI